MGKMAETTRQHWPQHWPSPGGHVRQRFVVMADKIFSFVMVGIFYKTQNTEWLKLNDVTLYFNVFNE